MMSTETRAAGLPGLRPETEACLNCRYFFRHYVRDGSETPWGHCVYPRLKVRSAFDRCDSFKPRESG